MAFTCQLVGLPMLPRNSLDYLFSSVLSPYLIQVLCAPLKPGDKGSIPTGITQFGAPELKLRSKQFGILYDQN